MVASEVPVDQEAGEAWVGSLFHNELYSCHQGKHDELQNKVDLVMRKNVLGHAKCLVLVSNY